MCFLFWTKGSQQSPGFDTSKCSGENLPNSSCHFPKHKSLFLQILHDSSVSWQTTPLYFLGQTLYTLRERDQLKCKLLRLLSARIKIRRILVIFEIKNRFFFKFTSLFCPNHIKFQLKKYRRIISHDTKEWYQI